MISFTMLCGHKAWSGGDNHVIFTPSPTEKIEGLRWSDTTDTSRPEVQARPTSEVVPTYFVKLKGSYPKIGAHLLLNGKNILFQAIAINEKGDFTIEMEVDSEKTDFVLTAITAAGEVQKQKGSIVFENWNQAKGKIPVPSGKKEFVVTSGVGITSISYRQSSVPDLSQGGVSAKISFRLSSVPRKWDAEVSSYFTVLPFSPSIPNLSLRFLGVNLRGGFHFKIGPRWSLGVMAGWYFLTTISSDESIGFQNIGGPQLFPAVEYQLAPQQAIRAYLKYSPIVDNFSILAIDNGEVAFGLGYSFFFSAIKHRISITTDFAMLKLTFSGSTIRLNTYTLGFSYPF